MTQTEQSPATSVRRDVTVPLDRAGAFEVFTTRMDAWWPREHHIGAADIAEAVLERKAGGRWYEKGVDGSECNWGRVDVYDPPTRLVLVWQITPEWQYDSALETQVEVTFEAVADNATRVTLEHHLEGFGEHAEQMRQMFEQPGAWAETLNRYATVAAGG
jgi:uncharacterized protein YndB with AHSA1/START domain